jgi:two-component system phosphate regulon sensor histidine kinase PhoR
MGLRSAIIGPDGTLVVDSQPGESRPILLHRPEVVAAQNNGHGEFQRRSGYRRTSVLSRAERIDIDGELLGFLLVERELSDVDAQVSAVRRSIWSIAALFAVALFAATWWNVGRIKRPVESLRNSATSMGAGVFDQRVVLEQRDEFGTLALVLDEMRDRIRSKLSTMEQENQQLEENSQSLSTVLAGMIEGVIAVDNSECILFLNRAARSFLDVTSSDVVGRPIWEVLRNPTLQEVVRAALQGEALRTAEFELPRSQAIVALIASLLPGDPCPGVVLVLHDVTELRRLENLRREFVSNVSHELKTPLTAIQAYSETLLGGAIDDPEHNREFLHRIEEQAERLHALVLDLLRLARIESGEDVFELTAIDVQDAIGQCLDEHAAVAEAGGLSLQLDAPEQRSCVRADREGLRTILDNLVDNAINHTPSGGRITIAWAEESAMVRIFVQDTGAGIPVSQQARVFERFYRVDKARSRELGGTGLGLAIVKHLTQVFGGSVQLESRVGEGSTFTVRLPKG